jgi:hypothetical protein
LQRQRRRKVICVTSEKSEKYVEKLKLNKVRDARIILLGIMLAKNSYTPKILGLTYYYH